MFNDLGSISLASTALQVGGSLLNAWSGFQAEKYNRQITQYAVQSAITQGEIYGIKADMAIAQGEFAANEALKRGEFEKGKILEQGRRVGGSALAQGVSQGLDMTSGTGLAMMREIAQNSSADAMQAMLSGQVSAINARLQAADQAMELKQRGAQARLSAGRVVQQGMQASAAGQQQGYNSLLGAAMQIKQGIKDYQSAKNYKREG